MSCRMAREGCGVPSMCNKRRANERTTVQRAPYEAERRGGHAVDYKLAGRKPTTSGAIGWVPVLAQVGAKTHNVLQPIPLRNRGVPMATLTVLSWLLAAYITLALFANASQTGDADKAAGAFISLAIVSLMIAA